MVSLLRLVDQKPNALSNGFMNRIEDAMPPTPAMDHVGEIVAVLEVPNFRNWDITTEDS